MTAVITLDVAKERIRRLAEERPDFVYEPIENETGDSSRCVYFDQTGDPSCIVGHAFADELRKAGVNHQTRCSAAGLRLNGYLDLTSEAADFLSRVQEDQDSGIPWGKAYSFATEA